MQIVEKIQLFCFEKLKLILEKLSFLRLKVKLPQNQTQVFQSLRTFAI